METNILIVSVILIAIILIPIALVIKNSKKSEKLLSEALKSISKGHGLTIHEKSIWNNKCIAIDIEKKVLLYFCIDKEIKSTELIELSDVDKCTLNKVAKNVKTGKDSYLHIEKLELIFHFKDKRILDSQIEFYNFENSLQLSNEHYLTDKWQKIINKYIA